MEIKFADEQTKKIFLTFLKERNFQDVFFFYIEEEIQNKIEDEEDYFEQYNDVESLFVRKNGFVEFKNTSDS